MKFGTLYAYWTHEWHANYSIYLEKAKAIGFDILELSAGNYPDMSRETLLELKHQADSLGIEMTSNIGPAKKYDVASSDTETRRRGINYLIDIMERMTLLGSTKLVGVMYTYWPNDFTDLDKPAIWERGVESLKIIGKRAEELGIELCLEVVNRFETHILNTADEGIVFCRDVDCPSVKLLLDTFHMNIEEDNIADAILRTGSLLGHLHVGEGNRKLPGEGHLPWHEIGTALNKIGFDGGVVMEPFVTMGGKVGEDIKVWRDLSCGADIAEMDAKIKRSVDFLRNQFGGNNG